MTRPLVEICADSLDSVRAAELGGADRVELCASLLEGGLTPSLGSIRMARQVTALPLVVLIRPRGGDFLYSEEESEAMRRDIEAAASAGADGVALGALTPFGDVDHDTVAALVAAARPLSVTFHRAFDLTLDPWESLEEIITLGCDRVLTSGQAATAEAGLECLTRLVEQAEDRISVMPGCGIRSSNVAELLARTGAREVHLSATRFCESEMVHRNEDARMGAPTPGGEYRRAVTDPDEVRRVVELVGGKDSG